MTIRISKKMPIILGLIILLLTAGIIVGAKVVNAQETQTAGQIASTTLNEEESGAGLTEGEEAVAAMTALAMSDTGTKALAAAIAVGLAAAAGAIAMGIAIAKSAEGISRQPEAEGSIRTTLMLGLVFIETAIIYALIVAILIIFVM